MKFISLIVCLPTVLSCWGCGKKVKPLEMDSRVLQESPNPSTYGHCQQILQHGVFEEKTFRRDYYSKHYLVQQACSTLQTYSSADDDRWYAECKESHSSNSTETGVDLVIKAVPIGADLDHSEERQKAWCVSRESRYAYRTAWFEHHCTNLQSESTLEDNTNHALRQASPTIVDAWRTCIMQNYQGLSCFGEKLGDSGLSLNVLWNPGPLSPTFVKLDWQVSKNLKLIEFDTDTVLPRQLGRGDRRVGFQFNNLIEDSYIGVTASDERGGQVSCNYKLMPQEPKECKNGKLVGAISGKVYLARAKLCEEADECEAQRLEALISGKVNLQLYRKLKADNWIPFYSEPYNTDSTLRGYGPCTLDDK